MEAINTADLFKGEIEQYEMEMEEYDNKSGRSRPARPRPSPILNNQTIFDHVKQHLKAIRNSELENTLRFLNFK